MSNSSKRGRKAYSIPGGMAIAALVSMMVTILFSIVIAHFLNTEQITWSQAGYWIMGMLFVSAFAGGKSAVIAIKHQTIAVSMMSGVLYWGLLLCITALFFGGSFGSLWETAGIIGAGSGTAALITRPTGKGRGRKSGKIYC